MRIVCMLCESKEAIENDRDEEKGKEHEFHMLDLQIAQNSNFRNFSRKCLGLCDFIKNRNREKTSTTVEMNE